MKKRANHKITMYSKQQLDKAIVEPDKLKAIFDSCLKYFNLTEEEVRERYAFSKTRFARWFFVYIAESQSEKAFPAPALGYYLDRYDNEVYSIKRTARKNVTKDEYFRTMLFDIVRMIKDKGYNIRLPKNLVGKYNHYEQNKIHQE